VCGLTANFRLNGQECVVSTDGNEVLPFEGATIVVKHSSVNSQTGKLCNPIYWRMKNSRAGSDDDNNKLTQSQESFIFITSLRIH